MPRPEPLLYLDLVDPGSLVMLHRVRSAAGEVELDVGTVPFEIRPPPEAMVDPSDPAWRAYWTELRPALEELGVVPTAPRLVPRTRKAHELVLEAEDAGCDADPVGGLLRAFIEDGADIGRVDVLLPLARSWKMELTRTKAVLDVDRHAERVEALRAEAMERGVRGVPTLGFGDELLEGIHEAGTIRRWLGERRRLVDDDTDT